MDVVYCVSSQYLPEDKAKLLYEHEQGKFVSPSITRLLITCMARLQLWQKVARTISMNQFRVFVFMYLCVSVVNYCENVFATTGAYVIIKIISAEKDENLAVGRYTYCTNIYTW